MTRIELLVSTMNNEPEFLKNLNIKTDVVVVNQCDDNSIEELEINGYHITWINSTTRGLSKSRNIAIEHSKAEFVVLTDDDMEYRSDYANTIVKAFEKYNVADVLAFQVKGIERKFKDYSNKARRVSFIGSMKISSVELAFRRKSIVQNKIKFNENFGTGTAVKMGEENIFLFQCLKNKLKIQYVPYIIADLHMEESTWFHGFDKKYFYDRGVVYYEMFGWLAPIMLIQFMIRKYHVYHGQVSFFEALNQSINGVKRSKNNK
ncbi:glycosyltransferase family 2 protein [Eubacterium ramulus]|uniref:glycosyltransferase family 2 protein n=1 Tax=Eubacterium ramulus TaxID=39490 RepID=UPI0022DFBCE5|nr:glycosyltransferase [Eubacterium ramulus]